MANAPTTGGPAAGASVTVTPGRLSGRAREIALRMGGLVLAIAIVVAIFTLLAKPNTFFTFQNSMGMLRFMSTYAIVALGLTLVIVVGEIDLSFGYMYGLASSLIAVAWVVWGWPVWAAILLAFGAAIAVGSFNAFFVTVLRIPSFIVTLGSGQLIFGFTLFVTNTATFNPAYPPAGKVIDPGELAFFRGFAQQDLFFRLPGQAEGTSDFLFPMQGIWMIGAAIIIGFILNRSLFGFRLKAIGGNPAAAELARLPVRKYKFAAFILCAAFASLAGLLDFSFIESTQPNAGQALVFPVFAAVIIGGASLSGGRGTAFGTVLGAMLLAIISNGLSLLTVGPSIYNFVSGSVTIAAVALDRLTHSLRR